MIAPCSHGMPTPAACVDCMYEGNVELPPAPRTEVVHRMVAKLAGDCPLCNLPINVGDPIQLVQHTGPKSGAFWYHGWCSP